MTTICLVILLFLLALFGDVVRLTLRSIVVVLVDLDWIGKVVLLVDYDFVVVFGVSWISYRGQSLLVDNLVVHDLRLPVIILLWMIAGGIQDALLSLQEILVICLRPIIGRIVMWLLVGGLAAPPDFTDLLRDLLRAVVHRHVVDEVLDFLLVVRLRECWVDQIFAKGLHIFVSAHWARVLSFGNALPLSHALDGRVLRGGGLGAAQRAPLAEILSGARLDVDAAGLLDIPPILLVYQVLVSLLLTSWVI